MCIPYLHDRAQSLSHLVMDTSPNLIMIIDDDMRIRVFGGGKCIRRQTGGDQGKPLEDLSTPRMYASIPDAHKSVHSRKVIYPDRNLVTLQNIAYIDDGNFVIATIDVTREEKQANRNMLKKATIDLAQNVIYKQMMVALSIAGLLGRRRRRRRQP